MSITARQFVDTLSTHGILPTAQVAGVGERLSAEDWQADAESLARALVQDRKLTKFQAQNVYQGRGKGLVYGEYVVLDKLGEGGMGQVYKARHRRMKRVVALKILPPSAVNSPRAVERFHQEVEVAAQLQHPNIVIAHDAGEAHGRHYLAMEHVEGADLSSHVNKHGPLGVEQAANVVLQAARGLAYAHKLGIIHRDVKPSNLLINRQGVVKILDMGLARFDNPLADAASVEKELTASGEVMGTVDYMAPEQATDTRTADHRADVYALGCTLYRLLVGKPPYGGETMIQKILAHREQPIPPLGAGRRDVPEVLDRLYRKMLAKDPAERTPSMDVVVSTLEKLLSGVSEERSSVVVDDPTPQPDALNFSPPDAGASNVLAGQSNVISGSQPGSTGGRLKGSSTTSPVTAGPAIATARLVTARRAEPTSGVTAGRTETTTAVTPQPGFRRLLIGGGIAALLLVGAAAYFLGQSNSETTQSPPGELAAVSAPAIDPPPAATATSTVIKAPPAVTMSTSLPASTSVPPQPATPAPTSLFGLPVTPPPAAVATAAAVPTATATAPPTTVASAATPTTSIPPTTSALTTTGNVPPATTAARAAQIIVVGVGPGEARTLDEALKKAAAGDTILVRHRGPLEFNPVDLTGKSPLTIAGDAKDGVDFWPILRQAPITSTAAANPTTADLFYGENVELTLRKIHLAAGGPKRSPLSSVVALGAGRVSFDHCTVTVGGLGEPGEPLGDSLPVVRNLPDVSGPVELVLDHSVMRGARLNGLIAAEKPDSVKIRCEQTLWAGGKGPWLAVRDARNPLRVSLDRTTVYNASCFLHWESSPGGAQLKPAVEIESNRSVYFGGYADPTPLIDWNPTGASDLTKVVADGEFVWRGEGNVYHRFAGYYRDGKSKLLGNVGQWKTLLGDPSPTSHRESDPMFRVMPEGYPLQEVTPFDFEARFQRNPLKVKQLADNDLGMDQAALPVPPMEIISRSTRVTSDVAAQLRGTPRILKVHQKDGPYKTLEAAFAEVRDEEIIEIQDSGRYVPVRNFTSSPGSSVLVSPVAFLTIRAAINANPTIILSEAAQQGNLPLDYDKNRFLVLLASIRRSVLHLDGLHFRYEMSGTRQAFIRASERRQLRCTNCSFVVPGGNSPHDSNSGLGASSNSALIWIENSIVLSQRPNDIFLRVDSTYDSSELMHLDIRNCLFVTPRFFRHRASNSPRTVTVELVGNSFVGDIGAIDDVRQARITAHDNFCVAPGPMWTFEDAGVLRGAAAPGGNNALWVGSQPMTDQARLDGVNALLPGPTLKTPPQSEGPSTPADPLKTYRLKKGQPVSTMAADGGPVGVRFEYLPTLPLEPKP